MFFLILSSRILYVHFCARFDCSAPAVVFIYNLWGCRARIPQFVLENSNKMFYADLREIVRAKFDFDVVGHYAQPEVLSLVLNDKLQRPVSFTCAAEKSEATAKP